MENEKLTPEKVIEDLKEFIVHFQDEIDHDGYGDPRFDTEQAKYDIQCFEYAIEALKHLKK